MGRLTTHVLDTAHGKPGRDVEIHLYNFEGIKASQVLLAVAAVAPDARLTCSPSALMLGMSHNYCLQFYLIDREMSQFYYNGVGL